MRLLETVLTAGLCGLALGGAIAQHEPWDLVGAQDRIERYRMGECRLELRMPDGAKLPQGTRVQLRQTKHHFKFGGSLAQARVLDGHHSYDAYKERFAHLFNYATIGFYWALHERSPGQWQLQAYTERSMDWAVTQEMMLRGHPLMWHNTLPAWVADPQRDVVDLDREIMAHVEMLVARYPQIDQWDLYNETPGIRLVDSDQGARRWVESYGGAGPITERMVSAVRTIRSDVRLSVNHFKYDERAYHEQIRYCLEHDVAIDAIGIQSHMHTRDKVWSEEQMWSMLEDYKGYGLPIELSEISVLSCEPFATSKDLKIWKESISQARRNQQPLPVRASTAESKKNQADYVRDFYTLAFSHPSVSAIIWWSVSDYQAWRGVPAGLLDAEAGPKPAYEALEKLIKHEWWTEEALRIDASGQLRFRGFYGAYEVVVEALGQPWTVAFDLSPGRGGVISLTLQAGEALSR